MEKVEESKYPFEVSLDERIDPDSVTFRIIFGKELPDREEFESIVKAWADKGISEGYGKEKMHYLDSEPDESGEGGFEWNEEEGWVEFFADLGSTDKEALEALFGNLISFDQIKEVKVGSGYDW